MTAFKTALDFEKKGYEIYTDAAKKAKNKFLSRVFLYLADQEKIHIDSIKECLKEQKIRLSGDSLEDTKKFFSTTIDEFKDKLELCDTDKELYETALGLEKDSYDYYCEWSKKISTPELSEFLKFLMIQEKIHIDLIQKTCDCLGTPGQISLKMEKWMQGI